MTNLCGIFGCKNPSEMKKENVVLCRDHFEEERISGISRDEFFELKKVKIILNKCPGCGIDMLNTDQHIIKNSQCVNVCFGSTWDGLFNFPGAEICPHCGCGRDSTIMAKCTCGK